MSDAELLHRWTLEVPEALYDIAVAALADIWPQGFEEHDLASPEGTITGVRYVVHALPEEAAALGAALSRLAEHLRSLSTEAVHLHGDVIPNQNWREAWKVHFTLQRVPPFVIRPSWIPYTPGSGEHLIHLDPGSAFGTGLHESTRLCLRALASLFRELSPTSEDDPLGRPFLPTRVLDFGTGTGILGIAACRLFPCEVLAVDNDPFALTACEENAKKNAVENRFQMLAGLPEPLPTHDLTLANVSRPVLVEHASTLVEATCSGGTLVLSGLLVSDATAVLEAFTSLGAALVERTQENDWIALRLITESP